MYVGSPFRYRPSSPIGPANLGRGLVVSVAYNSMSYLGCGPVNMSDNDFTSISLGGNRYTFPEMIAAIFEVGPTSLGFSVETSSILFASSFGARCVSLEGCVRFRRTGNSVGEL